MLLKSSLALMWSMNGLIEKELLQRHSPDAYAATKALCVTAGYLLTRQPIDVTFLSEPTAWVLFITSMLNTPVYARIAQQENPAVSLPIVVAISQLLRLLWSTLFFKNIDWTYNKLVGTLLVILGGWLLSK